MTKYLKSAVLFSVLILCLGWQASAQESLLLDKIIAKVGGEIVLLSDVEDQYAYFKQAQPGVDEGVKCDILEGVIAQKLLINQAKRDSLEITPEEVDQQLEFRFNSILQQMNGDEEFFKEYYGATVSEMKERFREDQREQILSEKMQRKLIDEVDITPQEVKEFFESIPEDSLEYINSEVELREIVYKPQVNKAEFEAAYEKITDIRKRIVDDGEDFGELAKKYSQDGAAPNGGDLGFSNRGQMVADYEAVAYGLKNGEISDIVETEFGLHLINMIERRGNRIHTRHILVRPRITASDLILAEKTLDSIKTQIEIDSISFSSAHSRHSDKSSQSYHYSGRLKNPQSGSTYFETGELPSDIYFAIEGLEVGMLSEPLEFTDARGDTYYRIVRLDSRTRPHQMSMESDYSKIEQLAKESKKNVYLTQWIEERYKSTYIEINKKYDFCPNVNAILEIGDNVRIK